MHCRESSRRSGARRDAAFFMASSLLREELVDRLTLFIAPLFLGPEAADPFLGLPSPPLAQAHHWSLVRSATFGSDALISVEP